MATETHDSLSALYNAGFEAGYRRAMDDARQIVASTFNPAQALCRCCADVGLPGRTCTDCGCAVYGGSPVLLQPGASDPRN